MGREIPVNQFEVLANEIWDSNWFLLTCGDYKSGHFNTMTVSWGSFGNMWNLPFAMVVVRHSRYTFEFINQYDNFTLCAFPEKYRPKLTFLGTRSGRDGDKIGQSGLTPQAAARVSSPIFEEAELTIECQKLYWHDYAPDNFLDDRIKKHYPEKDYHRMVFGEILAVHGEPSKFSKK